MKKNFFFGLFALATMMVTSSCSEQELVDPSLLNGDVVTFTVNLQQSASTRAAAELAGRGTQADKLYYGVYEKTSNNGWALIPAISATTGDYDNDKTPSKIEYGKPTQVEIKLAKQKEYSVIFWAANAGNDMCDVNWESRTMTVSDDVTANNEKNDVFWACDTVELNGAVAKTVNLYRPFAQLNIGASVQDIDAAAAAAMIVEESQIVLEKVANIFNMQTGEASGDTTLTYRSAAILNAENWKFPVGDHEYEYIALGYVLADTDDKSLVDVKLTYTDTKRNGYNSSFTSVPVQRNFRTNIYGNLLSNSADYNVNVQPDLGNGENIEVVEVATAQEILEVIENLQDETPITIVLNGDIDLNDLFGSSNARATRAASDLSLTIAADKELILDMNNKKLSAISYQTGKNYNMFDVRGTLTVKNGTIEYKHEGDNMGWSASTNLFNITAGGVLNLDGVTAKNLGGSDMAFVAHLNNWGEATLNVENSTLESTYIAVRVFNSGNDLNNVTIKKSTLKGKYCFWVHNYKDAGDSVGTDETLNFDIYNNENTFECTGKAPILYGFANPIYYDAYGYEFVADGLSYNAANKEYAISSANGLVALSKMTIKGNERVVLAANIDLTGVEFTGLLAFNPESNNTFDGQNHTVSNWTYTGGASDMGFFKSWVGNIKNVTFSNCSLKTAGRSAIVAGNTYSNIENVHVVDCSIEDSYWACGLISGLYNSGNVSNCSATNSSVKSNGGTAAIVGVLNETAGTRSFTNCKVEGCIINNTGVYGEVYSGAAIVGMINISNSTVKFTKCQQQNNTFIGNHVYDVFHAPADEDITIVIE